MEKNIVIICLNNTTLLISDVQQTVSELGEPDLILNDPYLINQDGTISPWLQDYSSGNTFKIHSDKVITMFESKQILLEKYLNITK
jgi:hypothetical protein